MWRTVSARTPGDRTFVLQRIPLASSTARAAHATARGLVALATCCAPSPALPLADQKKLVQPIGELGLRGVVRRLAAESQSTRVLSRGVDDGIILPSDSQEVTDGDINQGHEASQSRYGQRAG